MSHVTVDELLLHEIQFRICNIGVIIIATSMALIQGFTPMTLV